jgi:hypothetical protein
MQEDGIESRLWSFDVLNEYRVAALLREKTIPVVILELYVGNFPKFTVTVKLIKIRISRIFLHTEEKYSSRRRKA